MHFAWFGAAWNDGLVNFSTDEGDAFFVIFCFLNGGLSGVLGDWRFVVFRSGIIWIVVVGYVWSNRYFGIDFRSISGGINISCWLFGWYGFFRLFFLNGSQVFLQVVFSFDGGYNTTINNK